MTKIRPELKNSEWAISKHSFYTAYHYALQYNEWRDRYIYLMGIDSINFDGMPPGSGKNSPTEKKGIEIAELRRKISLVEETAMETAPELYKWIIKAVTNEGISYTYLSTYMGIPCGKNLYYNRRRKFYYLLSQKIGVD